MFALLSLSGIVVPTFAQNDGPVTRIAFGSCVHQDKDQPIWSAVNAENPELFIFLGDNIYGDSRDIDELGAKYEKLAAKPGFQTLREQTEVIATWDDHDYGENDAGAEYPLKEESRQLMLDFWGEPMGTERRTRKSGLYTSYYYGPEGQRVQVILLDLRWNRSRLKSVSVEEYEHDKKPKHMGPYEPTDDTEAELLGELQWQWLEKELRKPADLRLLGSSIQLLPEFTGWESWANFPHERKRLFDLIRKHEVENLMVISGDTHWSELSRVDDAVKYPLWELTSSGLTEKWKEISPNKHRQGGATHKNNYGLIEIDWNNDDPEVTLSIKGLKQQVYLQKELRLSQIANVN